ncbi:AsmA-like C-terminal region-containing protein [Polluticaenibacter yanchengensis]|uniref:AsmA family protein n=1 Tax=Polluticaenibacter yanchengensis TaxID=3014562 RepID=A0ABT4UJH9_9BACT|nr:hypothetical protein [Chitinophagaceae bacterium LY-5]
MIRKILKRALYFLLSVFILFLLMMGILLNFVFTPDKITPVITKLINENIDANVSFEKMELTFFSSFPYLKAEISNGSLVNKNNRDTAATFKEISAVININQLMFKKNIALRKVKIINPSVAFILDSTGKSNWDILKPSQPDTASGESFTIKEFKLKELIIENAALKYNDEGSHLYLDIPSTDLKLSARYNSENISLKLDSKGRDISFLFENQPIFRHLNTVTSATMHLDKKNRQLKIVQTDLKLNNIDFALSGELRGDSANKQLIVDLESELKVESLKDLWAYIPKKYLPVEGANVSGLAYLKVKTTGRYGKKSLPVTTSHLQIKKGTLSYQNFPGKIDLLDADIESIIDLSSAEKSRVIINQLDLQGTGLQLKANGTVTRIFEDPVIDAKLGADINFSTIKKVFPVSKDILLNGSAKANLSGIVHYDLKKGIDYKSIAADGNIEMNALDIRMLKDSFTCKANNALLTVQRNKAQNITGKLNATGFDFNYKNEQKITFKSLNLSFSKMASDTGRFPITAGLHIYDLHYRSQDSLTGKVTHITVDAGLFPNKDFAIASIRGSLNIDSASITKHKLANAPKDDHYNNQDHYLQVKNFSVKMFRRMKEEKGGVTKGTVALTRLRYQSGDSVRASLRNATLKATMVRRLQESLPMFITSFQIQHAGLKKNKDFFAIKNGSYDLTFKKDTIRDWWPNGTVSFGKLIAYLPELGMPLSISESTVGVDNHSVKLNNSTITAGHSIIKVNGAISNLYMPAGDRVPLKAQLSVHSDYIDANEIMSAMHKGEALIESISQLDNMPDIKNDSASYIAGTEKTVFQLPENINISFDLHVKRLLFGELNLDDINGTARVVDRKLLLPNASFKYQQALVETQLEYFASNSKTAHVKYALTIHDLEMKQIKDLAPSLDTLFPVAKTLEGKANFGIKGVAVLNEGLQPDIKSVKSVALLEANNITVGQSEAFRELAKTFMFKNKENTKIDSLNVELIINDNTLEVLPALVEIDRYRLAVGGTQNLDMSYNYHISVLKSQIPFKTGVDIKGTMPTYKISLSKAKYKFYFSDKAKDLEKADQTIIKKRKFILDKLKF